MHGRMISDASNDKNYRSRTVEVTSDESQRSCPNFNSLRILCVLGGSAVSNFGVRLTAEALRSRRETFEPGPTESAVALALAVGTQGLQQAGKICRQRRLEFHPVARARMVESQSRRMQEVPLERRDLSLDLRIANRVLAPAAISRIPDYRMTDVRQVNSYLMRAAGLDLHIQQREAAEAFGHFKNGMRCAAGSASKHRHSSSIIAAAPDASLDLAALLRHPSVDQRDVHFEHLAVAKLVRQAFVRAVVLCDDQQAGSFFVDSMDDARPGTSRLPGQLVEVMHERVRKRARLYPRAGVNDHTSGLADDDQVVVFENDVQRQRFGRELDWRRFRQIDFDTITRGHPVTCFHHVIADQDVAVFYGSLNSRSADLIEVRCKKGIEASARRFVAD